MTQFADRASLALASELAGSAARSLFLAGVAAVGLAASRTKATSLRLFTWTAVLYGSLALPLLGAFLPHLHVAAPYFVQHRISIASANTGDRLSTVATAIRPAAISGEAPARSNRRPGVSRSLITPRPERTSDEQPSSTSFSWNIFAATLYLCVTLGFLARFVAGIVWSNRLVNCSEPITELPTARLATQAGHRVSRLAVSESISVPVTVGAFRPTILLPSDWHEWEPQKLEAVLAHELSHVARHDPLTQSMALLYRAIFWFSPLAWWLHRHLSTLAEQASDEAALCSGADQEHYAQTLLDFFDALRAAPGRIRWQGVSMARAGQAEQRLERILSWKGTVPMNVKRSVAAAILLLVLPVVYLAASVRPAAGAAASTAQSPPQPPAPAVPPAPPVGGVSAVPPTAGVHSVAPVAPVAPTAPLAPEAPWDGFSQGDSPVKFHGKGFSYHYGFDDEERFVIVSGKTDSFTMSGSTQDVRHVERLKKQIPGDFIWFQRDEKSYIIRDQATIDRARTFWAPQEELGRKQEELGKQQEELGKQQEELGAKMEHVKVNVPDMTAALDKLKAKLQKLGTTATMEQIGDLQSEIGELQSRLGEIQSQAGDQQGKLGQLQGELGEKQGKLGEQQGELGRQQGELAEKATRQMKGLLDEAIKNGTAKPEEDTVKSPTL